MSAALVTLYHPIPGSGPRPPTEATFTTTPPRSAMVAATASWIQARTPSWFTSTVLAARDRSMPTIGPKYGLVAALLTRMSRAPNRSTVAATHLRACSGSPALATCQATGPSSPASVSAAPARASAFLDDSITAAPASARRRAMASPMPRLAPVTRAVRPSSRRSTGGTLPTAP